MNNYNNNNRARRSVETSRRKNTSNVFRSVPKKKPNQQNNTSSIKKPNNTTNVTKVRKINQGTKKLINSIPEKIISKSNTDELISWVSVSLKKNAFAYKGYFPLYLNSEDAITASPTPNITREGENTEGYHIHLIDDIVFYMPNGLQPNITQFHGNYTYKEIDNVVVIPRSGEKCPESYTTDSFDDCMCYSTKNLLSCLKKCNDSGCIKECECGYSQEQFECNYKFENFSSEHTDVLCLEIGKNCKGSMNTSKPYCGEITDFVNQLKSFNLDTGA